MVVIKSVNTIILDMINLLQLLQPNLDTKPSTVARDLVIDAPASQIALLYDELSKVSSQQSLRLVVGTDLDKLAKNFGLVRRSAVASNGIALFTFKTLQGTININPGDLVTASNGFSFSIINGLSIVASQSNFYRSVATSHANDLQFVGITDQFAVQLTVQATTTGSAGNISQFSLTRTNIPGVSNVTNTSAFSGGSNQEDDATFRNRILSVFSGSSIGTALGYRNTALATPGVNDAYVIGPGDPLMARDGTVTTSDSQGNLTIVSEGSGGKVDLAILGTELTQYTDSFIYHDKSNKSDPTAAANIFVLGQIAADANKTFNQKRLDDIATGTLPAQPVNLLLQVTGSISGSNFAAKTVDANGVVSGNYELIKDVSIFGGSPFGSDKLHWISDRISDFGEDTIKGQFNGQDKVTYPNVLQIPKVQQNIAISNENSNVLPTDNSLIQLLHTPATNVTRVFNVNTGERYTVIKQNFSGTGAVNTSGVIQISGNTLPSPSNTLQVDYSWIISYDQFSDYDGKIGNNNPRIAKDSIDWGLSNLVRSEITLFSINPSNTFWTGTLSLPAASIIAAKTFSQAFGTVSKVTSGVFAGRLSIVLPNLLINTISVDHVSLRNTSNELFVTAQNNGSFTTAAQVIGIVIEYITTIILPTDTIAKVGDSATIIMNSSDVFNTIGSAGSFTQGQITIPFANMKTSAYLNVSYIARIQNIISTGITSTPISRLGNGYSLLDGTGFNNSNPGNTSRREFQAVQLNLSSQFYIELFLSSLDYSLIPNEIISVIRLSDGLELWNADNMGTIVVNGLTNNYQLIFSGYHIPVAGDRVLVIYYATSLNKFQPFSFDNSIIEKNFSTLQFDPTDNVFIVPIHQFIAASGITFQVLDPVTNQIVASGTDGYIIPNSPTNSAIFGSSLVNFNNFINADLLPLNVLYFKIRVINDANPNNNGIFDISEYNLITNELIIGNNFSHLSNKQISIIRLLDGKELFYNGTIDVTNNRIFFPKTTNASPLDQVLILFYQFNNLKQAPTRLSVNITDQVNNSGTLSFNGTTISKEENILFTATATGLKQNLISAFRNASGFNSNSFIPANINVVKIAQLEKVVSTSPGGGEVLQVLGTYDIIGSTIADNTFFIDNFFSNPSLGNFDFILPNTSNNLSIAPNIGDTLRVTFYYATLNDLENVNFTRNGQVYTNKFFALIDKIYVSSGFNSSKSATLTLACFNQPITGSRYTVFYDYLAPVPNERIIVSYSFNKLISDVTFNIEKSRPINADILIKEAQEILVNVTMNVVISSTSINTASLILQNVKNALVSAINATALGTTLDSSSLVNDAFAVNGVAAARIITFNVNGKTGQVLRIIAQNNQFLIANAIFVQQVAT